MTAVITKIKVGMYLTNGIKLYRVCDVTSDHTYAELEDSVTEQRDWTDMKIVEMMKEVNIDC